MKTVTRPWFSLSAEGGTALRCADCDVSFDLEGPSLDHHPRVCPVCGVECVFLDARRRTVQIVLKNAHPAVAQAIRLLQTRFDEIDYVELLVAIEELGEALGRP